MFAIRLLQRIASAILRPFALAQEWGWRVSIRTASVPLAEPGAANLHSRAEIPSSRPRPGRRPVRRRHDRLMYPHHG